MNSRDARTRTHANHILFVCASPHHQHIGGVPAAVRARCGYWGGSLEPFIQSPSRGMVTPQSPPGTIYNSSPGRPSPGDVVQMPDAVRILPHSALFVVAADRLGTPPTPTPQAAAPVSEVHSGASARHSFFFLFDCDFVGRAPHCIRTSPHMLGFMQYLRHLHHGPTQRRRREA